MFIFKLKNPSLYDISSVLILKCSARLRFELFKSFLDAKYKALPPTGIDLDPPVPDRSLFLDYFLGLN